MHLIPPKQLLICNKISPRHPNHPKVNCSKLRKCNREPLSMGGNIVYKRRLLSNNDRNAFCEVLNGSHAREQRLRGPPGLRWFVRTVSRATRPRTAGCGRSGVFDKFEKFSTFGVTPAVMVPGQKTTNKD